LNLVRSKISATSGEVIALPSKLIQHREPADGDREDDSKHEVAAAAVKCTLPVLLISSRGTNGCPIGSRSGQKIFREKVGEMCGK